MKLKILHIIGEIKIGGVELSVLQFLKYTLSGSCAEKHFLCAKFSNNNIKIPDNVIALNLNTSAENPLIIFKNAIKLAKFIKENDINIGHAYNRNTTITLLIANFFLKNKIKTVSSISGMYNLNGFWRTLFNKIFLKTDYTVAPSKCAKEHFKNHYKIQDDTRIHVIYEGIDDSFLPKFPPFQNDVKVEKDAFKIFMLARFSPVKGQHILIEALKYLPRNLKYQCILIGPKKLKYIQFLNNLSQKFNVNVTILGEEFSYLINYADVIICPSTRAESFGRVAAEAGFLKKICIVSDTGGHLEIIEDGINGFFTKMSDPKDLAKKIQFVFNLPEIIKSSIKESAYQIAKEKFSIKTHVKKKIEFYQSIRSNQ